jgi:hypothetical protein
MGIPEMDSKMRQRMTEEFTIRLLGEYVTLTGWQWIELLDNLKPDTEMSKRISELILGQTDREIEAGNAR